MSKDNKYIPSGYKPSPLGIIPEDWEVKRIGDFGKVITGNTPPTEDTDNYGDAYKFVSPADISNSKYIVATEKHLSEKGFSISRQMPKGTVLFTCIGSTIGKCAIANESLTSNQQINAIICDSKHSGEFLYYELSHRSNRIKQIAGEQAVPIINKSTFENYKILCPPFEEQKSIAKILSLWDTAIAKQTALIEKLTLRKRGLMQQLLTGKKRLEGFCGEWKEVRLGEIGTAYGGLVNKSKEDFENGNALFITYMNVFSNGKIDTDNLGQVRILPSEKQEQVQFGDIFFTVSSETPDEVGMASVLLNEVENTYLNSFCFGYRLNDFKTIVPIFASYLFRGYDFRKEMYKIAQGSTRFNISKTEVLNMRIIIPSIEEQAAIASVLVNVDQEIELANKKLARMQEEKRGLMQVLLTGKKRVK